MVLRLREGHCRVSNLDDPAIVAEIKQAAETMRKAMVQLNELNSGLAAETSGQSLNQMMMMRWVILTKEEIAKKIINLVARSKGRHLHATKTILLHCIPITPSCKLR